MKNERILYKTNRKSIYAWTICLLVLAFSIITCTNFISNTKIAHADETETEQNQIVNFNQLFNNTTARGNYNSISFSKNVATYTISGSFTGYTLRLGFNEVSPSIPIVNGHKYYLNYNLVVNSGDTPQIQIFNTGGTVLDSTINTHIFTAVSNDTVSLGFFVNISYTYNFSVTPIFIDLTQMFGSNEPNLEECQTIFTSEYYIYTTGTPVNIDSLDSYSRGYTAGFNSAWESQNVSYKQFVIGAQSFAFNNQQYTAESTKAYDAIAGAYSFSGILGIPLGFTSVGGTNYEIDFQLLCTDWSQEPMSYRQEFSLYFYYVDSDNNLIQVGKIPYYEIDGAYGTYKGSFVCPVDTDTIYLEFTTDPLDNAPTVAVAFYSNITFRSQNIESAINSAFNAGAESMKETYLPGGDLYNEIYRNAYDQGVMDANTNNSVFQDGWHFIATAFGSVGEILSVELIPGVQIGVFVALPVLLGLIVLIVKILGKGS